MSVGIHFEHIVKKYGENVIIPDLNLDVKEGEFFTLLGPSGCGKTTLLRMVAGFNSIEGGTIAFNGKVINDIAPNKRNIGMVFQNYAVFPHMTVRENVAFGLENRHLPKNEIKKRVDEILESDVGTRCGVFDVRQIGDEYYAFIEECEDPKACSVLLRGGSKDALNEIERNLQDAMQVARNVVFDPRLLPGGCWRGV